MNREQCKGGRFFRGEGAGGDTWGKYCNHYLDTGVRRKIGEDGRCLSRAGRRRGVTVSSWRTEKAVKK